MKIRDRQLKVLAKCGRASTELCLSRAQDLVHMLESPNVRATEATTRLLVELSQFLAAYGVLREVEQ